MIYAMKMSVVIYDFCNDNVSS